MAAAANAHANATDPDSDANEALLRLLEEANAQLAKDRRAVSLASTATTATATAQHNDDKSTRPTDNHHRKHHGAGAAAATAAAAPLTTAVSTVSIGSAEEAADPALAREAAVAAETTAARHEAERALVHQWSETLASPEVSLKRRAKRVAELALAGIPAALRCLAWQQLARARARLAAAAAGRAEETDDAPSYPELLARPSPHEKMIRRDIARTFPTHSLFRDTAGVGQETLFNVIKAYSLYDTEVGYCQGSPFIVGILLMHMPEEDAFHLLTILMRDYKLRGLFKPSMADLPLRLYQLDRLTQAALPDLHAHFTDLSLEPSMYASQWFLTLFASSLPLSLVFRIIDVFLVEGITAVFRAALALLRSSHDALLRQNFEGAMEGLTRGGVFARFEGREDDFMAVFRGVSVPQKRLQRFEEDYAKSRAEEEAQRSELARYKAECERLQEENATLKSQVGGGLWGPVESWGWDGVGNRLNVLWGHAASCLIIVLPTTAPSYSRPSPSFLLLCSSSSWRRHTACWRKNTWTRACSCISDMRRLSS
jgi:chemotaxis protein histidine kinase CheA